MALSFKERFHFLFRHPEFKRRPLVVSFRLLVWLLCKKLGYAPKIRVHNSSRMQIYPEKRGMGAPGLIYVFRGGFEDHIPFCIRAFVGPGSSCFDIGANVGVWTLLMSEQCGNSGHVYSFEPLPRNAICLRRNIQLSHKTNIVPIESAVGKDTGAVSIYTPDDPGRTSLAPESERDGVQEVSLRRLDDIWVELGRPQIAFVKMDVEGSEPFVLLGGQQFFRECRPIVVSEINPHKLVNLGNRPEDIFNPFVQWDYVAFRFDDAARKLSQIQRCDSGDVVFIPRGHSALDSSSNFLS